MAELNNKELNEVTGGADQKEVYIGAQPSNENLNGSINSTMIKCEKCGMPYNANGVCPICNLHF